MCKFPSVAGSGAVPLVVIVSGAGLVSPRRNQPAIICASLLHQLSTDDPSRHQAEMMRS
jgi:hypothetical protein